MIKRGSVYWDLFVKMDGTVKKIPVLVLSINEVNKTSEYVNTVRLAYYDRQPTASHLMLPREAWNRTSEIGECIVRAETVSATKAAALYGPIAEIRPEWMKKVEEAVMQHLGMAPRTWKPETPYFPASASPQGRTTIPQEPIPPVPNRFSIDYTHRDSQTVPPEYNDSITRMYGQMEDRQ